MSAQVLELISLPLSLFFQLFLTWMCSAIRFMHCTEMAQPRGEWQGEKGRGNRGPLVLALQHRHSPELPRCKETEKSRLPVKKHQRKCFLSRPHTSMLPTSLRAPPSVKGLRREILFVGALSLSP